MKKIFIFILSLFYACQSYAQANKEIEIPETCYDMIIPDTLPYVMFLATEPKGLLKVQTEVIKTYSLETGEPLSSLNYNRQYCRMTPCPQGILLCCGKDTRLYDYQTGKTIRKFKIIPALSFDDMIIGYKGEKHDKLAAYNISTGKELWKTKIEKNYGEEWSFVQAPDSNSVICIGDHLWRLDFRTGERKEYKLKRRILDKKTNAGMAGLAVISGLLSGMVMYSPAYYSGLGSDVVVDSVGNMYVADRDAVACIDPNLDEIWRYQLPEATGSRSYLYLRGDTLDMLNTGNAWTGNRVRKTGKPFFASFDRHTGRNINILRLPEEWDEDTFGKNLDFVTEDTYIYDYTNDSFRHLHHTGERYPIALCDHDFMLVDSNLSGERIPFDSVFFKDGVTDEGTVLVRMSNDGIPEYVVIDAEGKMTDGWSGHTVSTFNSGKRSFTIRGNKLIVTR